MTNPFGGDRDTFSEFLFARTSPGLQIAKILASGLVGYLLGGFLYGAIFRPPYAGIYQRFLAGVLWGVLSAAFFGVPPTDEGGVTHTTTWPLILACSSVLYFGWSYADFRTHKRRRRAP